LRKLFVTTLATALAASGLFVFALAGSASADSTCGGSGPAGQFSDAYGNSGIQICITGTGVIDGTVTLAGAPNQSNPAGSSGYLVADGAPTNSGALSGYLGVSSGDNGGIVGCAAGDYQPAESVEPQGAEGGTGEPDIENHQILGIPPAVPPTPPDPADPCFPQSPA